MQEQQPEPAAQGAASTLARDIALYTVARFSMVIVVAVLLMLVNVPVLVALAVSVVVVMPLSLLVFGNLRRRVAVGMAERGAARRARREELMAQLRGERTTDAG
ncbi:DUF4229 domain-containing protein [Saccharopolyspora sp. NPDC000359]|uniref:DUF4229 domain-containing protein n=1 Tax=Saccharopolyspora sp. NPDC000359 TaxID=3154251 RepID=UPI0033306DE6